MDETESGFDFPFINRFQWLHLALIILLFLDTFFRNGN